MAGDGIQMHRRVGRTTNGRVQNNCILKCFTCHDICWTHVLPHHFHDAFSSLIADLSTFAIGRRDGRRTGQLHTQAFGQGIHRCCRTHGVAITYRRSRCCGNFHELIGIDLACCQLFARFPYDRARPRAFALPPAVQHRTDRQRNCRNIYRCGCHQQCRRGFITTDVQNNSIQRIAK